MDLRDWGLKSLFLAVLCAATLAVTPAFASKKVALVIGNGAYSEAPLKNPANDARAVATRLRSQGFEVILRENATKSQMTEVVADFGEKLNEGDTALFFFAGHGMQVQGRNYLVPTDARITSEQRVRLEALDVEAVLDQMAAARVNVSMVILDACRNNPFERRFRSVGGGLAKIGAPEGTFIAYATSPGKVAADGDGANGLYTQELLKALAQPGLKVEDVFKQVRIGVARASNGAQVPWEASSLTGDFYFQPAVATVAALAPVAAPPPVAAPAIDREAIFWDSVKGSSNPAELRAYLDAFPNGIFGGLARARIASLDAARQQQLAAARVVPAAAPPQQVAAASAARAGAALNGRFTANVPNGVLMPRSPYMFLFFENGTVRFLADERTSTTNYQCTGQGDLDANGAFDDVEITCRTNGGPNKTIASGTAKADGSVLVTFESANGRKTDIAFK